jgi:hypothetical protein
MRRAVLLVLVAACGDDGGEPPRLTITSTIGMFRATSEVGIDCGGGGTACDVTLPAPDDVSVAITNLRPQSCFFWKADVMPPEAGTCTVTGTTGTCALRVDRAVTVTIGLCVNP